ncbi:hypothetical protein FACS1894166_09610 [Bacilli bacterium]|nr:hypothetical protein FACS1894166_09610 [Bacilli bacterium]
MKLIKQLLTKEQETELLKNKYFQELFNYVNAVNPEQNSVPDYINYLDYFKRKLLAEIKHSKYHNLFNSGYFNQLLVNAKDVKDLTLLRKQLKSYLLDDEYEDEK